MSIINVDILEEANAAFEKWYVLGMPKKEAELCLSKNHHGIYTLMKVYTDHMVFMAGYMLCRQSDNRTSGAI